MRNTDSDFASWCRKFPKKSQLALFFFGIQTETRAICHSHKEHWRNKTRFELNYLLKEVKDKALLFQIDQDRTVREEEEETEEEEKLYFWEN